MKTKTTVLEGVERYRLVNGLTVLLRQDRSVPIVTSMIWYRVGSRCEREGLTGISHFLEHMMFKGTNRYGKGEIDYITTRHGGGNNAFTSHDYTAYYFSFASDRWWPALEIEADRMAGSRIQPEEFELERRVIIEELKMDLDSPWGALRHQVETHAFQVHPYRFPVIGFYEDLLSLSRDQMIDHYRRFYIPNNATLVVVGDFPPDRTLERIRALFEALPPGTLSELTAPAEAPRSSPLRIRLKRPTQIPRILIALPAPSVRQPEYIPFQVLDALLSEGKLARLYRRLVEEEHLAALVESNVAETFDPYLLSIQAELHEDVDVERVVAVIFEELERLRRQPVSPIELKRAQNQCVTQFWRNFETPLDQAVQLGLLETLDRFEFWCNYEDRIRCVTPEDLLDVGMKYLAPERALIGTLVDGAE